jgi:nucleoside-diphosphate-sugar epimerase
VESVNMSRPEKIVVFGGAGFIGSVLTSQLLEEGNEVTVAGRSTREDTGHPRLRYLKGTVTDAQRMMELIDGAAVVYDLSSSLGAKWEEYEEHYVRGTENVARACLAHGVRRLIYTSSTAALYLGASGQQDESAGPDPKPLERAFYSRGKIYAEGVLNRMYKIDQLPAVILRPAAVVGEGGRLIHATLGDLAAETRILGLGSGNTPIPFVLVEDVARALVLAKDAPGIEGKTFNLAGDVRLTAREYVAILRERTYRNFQFFPRSLFSMGAAEYFRWSAKAIMRKNNNVLAAYRDLKSASLTTQLDCSAAKRLLGWKPVSDRQEFIRKAIDIHIKPLPPGDVRLSAPMLRA